MLQSVNHAVGHPVYANYTSDRFIIQNSRNAYIVSVRLLLLLLFTVVTVNTRRIEFAGNGILQQQ